MKIPEPEHNIQSLIDKHHEAQAEPPRPHMGCSQLGHPCDRWLWLSFRWAVQPQFPGRILRLFRRGHMEEATIVSDLRAIGMDIRGTTGRNQARVDFGAHVSGSIDAIIESGVPEAPKKRHVAEFKTHSKKSFDALVKEGAVASVKPEHFIQMQLYMHGLEIDRALYVAVCKDDDRIYTERVRYEKDVAERYIRRGHYIALSDRMPPPISTDPSWYQCKFCDAHEFCHSTKTTKQVNCRTCAHSTAKEDSTWRCERHDADGIFRTAVDNAVRICQVHQHSSFFIVKTHYLGRLEDSGCPRAENFLIILELPDSDRINRANLATSQGGLRGIFGETNHALETACFGPGDITGDSRNIGVIEGLNHDLVAGPQPLESVVHRANLLGKTCLTGNQKQQYGQKG